MTKAIYLLFSHVPWHNYPVMVKELRLKTSGKPLSGRQTGLAWWLTVLIEGWTERQEKHETPLREEWDFRVVLT